MLSANRFKPKLRGKVKRMHMGSGTLCIGTLCIFSAKNLVVSIIILTFAVVNQ